MDSDQRLDLLRERYRASLPGKRDMLRNAWHAFRANPRDAGARAQLRTLLHRLAGSAPAYGHVRLGEVAGAASRRLGNADDAAEVPIDPRDVADAVAPLLDELMRVFATVIEQQAGHGESAGALRVILVDGDSGHAAAVESGLLRLGCEVAHVAQPESFWQMLTTWPCDAVVIDCRLDRQSAHDILQAVRGEPTFVRVVLACLVDAEGGADADVLGERGCDFRLDRGEPLPHLFAALRRHVDARRHD